MVSNSKNDKIPHKISELFFTAKTAIGIFHCEVIIYLSWKLTKIQVICPFTKVCHVN